jgi:hypothetical protein
MLDFANLPRYASDTSFRIVDEGEHSFYGTVAATGTLEAVTPAYKRPKHRRVFWIKNRGTAMFTLQANSGNIYNGAAVTSMALQPGEGVILVADNANWEVIASTAVYDEYKLITSAQLLALNATPISVITAKGAGIAVVPTRWAIYKPAGTAYAGVAAGEDLVLKYTDASGEECSMQIETTGFLDQATAQMRMAGMPAAAISPVANAAIVLHLLTGEITTGTSDLSLRVWYDIVPTVFTT